jgi:hypothetical protein
MEEEKENESDGDQDDGMDLPEPRSSTIKELLTTIQEVNITTKSYLVKSLTEVCVLYLLTSVGLYIKIIPTV